MGGDVAKVANNPKNIHKKHLDKYFKDNNIKYTYKEEKQVSYKVTLNVTDTTKYNVVNGTFDKEKELLKVELCNFFKEKFHKGIDRERKKYYNKLKRKKCRRGRNER